MRSTQIEEKEPTRDMMPWLQQDTKNTILGSTQIIENYIRNEPKKQQPSSKNKKDLDESEFFLLEDTSDNSNGNAVHSKKNHQSTCSINDSLLKSMLFISNKPLSIPLKHHCFSKYESVEENLSSSFHQVSKVIKKNTKNVNKPRTEYFFKQNRTCPIDNYMYELEAANCAFYQLLAPYHSPTARALYNENYEYIGIVSKSLAGFQPTTKKSLQESSFEIEALKHVRIEDLDALDEKMQEENLDLSNISDSQILSYIFSEEKSQLFPITAKDLRNYRTIKGLAIGLTTSYIFEEDDCHRGNVSADGKRVDTDMSSWSVVFPFKQLGIIDWTFRKPAGRFKVTARDILNLPDLKDASPFYWPTIPARYIPEAFISIASKFFTISNNAFKSQDNVIYQRLSTHPVFIYHKYTILLKYILTNETIYRNLCKLHIREESTLENKNVINMLSQHQGERIKIFKNELLNLPDFKEFLITNGDKVLKTIIKDFSKHNEQFAKKINSKPLYQEQVIDLNHVVKEYVDICTKLRIIKNPQDFKVDPDIANKLGQNASILKKSL
ncbi:MAG: hypothetical protein KIT56_05965 [Gammaproteobacteria bacterium]|nr:hypothetical protein [Gammaproteobacteria bacterium]MCW5583415.1 hypothetical protein [Gammaproteobacteria bacterium]